jgi:hypothetical protein
MAKRRDLSAAPVDSEFALVLNGAPEAQREPA